MGVVDHVLLLERLPLAVDLHPRIALLLALAPMHMLHLPVRQRHTISRDIVIQSDILRRLYFVNA